MGDYGIKKHCWNLKWNRNKINKDSFSFFFIFKMCQNARLAIQQNPIKVIKKKKKKKSTENHTFFLIALVLIKWPLFQGCFESYEWRKKKILQRQ